MRVFLTQSAIADLESIGDWIAADSPERARAFVLLLRTRCQQIADMPRAFPLVPRYESRGVRRRPVGDLVRQDTGDIEILGVFHAALPIERYLL